MIQQVDQGNRDSRIKEGSQFPKKQEKSRIKHIKSRTNDSPMQYYRMISTYHQ